MKHPYILPTEPPCVRADVTGESILAPHWPHKPEVLEAVRGEMALRGHVLIRACPDGLTWWAIEGSHRLWVASETGTVVSVQPITGDYRVQHNPLIGIVTAAWIMKRNQDQRAAYRIERC